MQDPREDRCECANKAKTLLDMIHDAELRSKERIAPDTFMFFCEKLQKLSQALQAQGDERGRQRRGRQVHVL